MVERVMAAAVRKVPASMRSGMTVNSAEWRRLTPWMQMVLLEAKRMRAPQALRKLARSRTSGSWDTR